MAQGPVERTSTLGEFQTLGIGVQVRPSSRQTGHRVRLHHPLGMIRIEPSDQSQQLTLGVLLSTSDAGPDWPNLLSFDALHHQR
jgi:hypothetical protein